MAARAVVHYRASTRQQELRALIHIRQAHGGIQEFGKAARVGPAFTARAHIAWRGLKRLAAAVDTDLAATASVVTTTAMLRIHVRIDAAIAALSGEIDAIKNTLPPAANVTSAVVGALATMTGIIVQIDALAVAIGESEDAPTISLAADLEFLIALIAALTAVLGIRQRVDAPARYTRSRCRGRRTPLRYSLRRTGLRTDRSCWDQR